MKMACALLLLLVCVAAASAATFHFQQPDNALDGEWAAFKTAFRRTYPSSQHEAVRRVVWEQNMRYIQKHNFEEDLGKHSYRLGMNQFGDLTNAEYRQLLLCRVMNRTTGGSTFLRPSNVKLPDTVDWRTKGYVTPVKDQIQCGSCWAFSTTGSVEGQHFRKTGKLVSLSEQQLVDCSRKYYNYGCKGGVVNRAFNYIIQNGGIDKESSYPYEGKDGPCRFQRADVGATIRGYVDISRGLEFVLQYAVATAGPVSVGIDAGQSSFQLYKSGVYNDPACSSNRLNHAVLAVGYGTESGQDYWLVKNSWGTFWGQQGYIKMSRNLDNQCGIATQASYPLV